jgi:hypothetical protein
MSYRSLIVIEFDIAEASARNSLIRPIRLDLIPSLSSGTKEGHLTLMPPTLRLIQYVALQFVTPAPYSATILEL